MESSQNVVRAHSAYFAELFGCVAGKKEGGRFFLAFILFYWCCKVLLYRLIKIGLIF